MTKGHLRLPGIKRTLDNGSLLTMPGVLRHLGVLRSRLASLTTYWPMCQMCQYWHRRPSQASKLAGALSGLGQRVLMARAGTGSGAREGEKGGNQHMAGKSNGQIKAIETVYKGYRFRSRLEARWAVFFDALGVKWEYEKEGFDLGEAGWYLPDFWLPEFGVWAEIKPFDQVKIVPESEWLDLITRFRDSTEEAIVLLRHPGVWCSIRCWDVTDSSAGSYDHEYVTWGVKNGNPMLVAVHDHRDRWFYGDCKMSRLLDNVTNEASKEWQPDVEFYYRAMMSFRQARFEHGENGAPQNGKV
jgi:hypothetical protein